MDEQTDKGKQMSESDSSRLQDVKHFYALLDQLEKKVGGKRTLAKCDGRMYWPMHGVYFFFETGENRAESGSGLRVVRVGTHALKTGSTTTLWHRLKQHRGNEYNNGGNHRGSVFRHHVGTALADFYHWPDDIIRTWPRGSSATREVRDKEHPYEVEVSKTISRMPFLWLAVGDAAGPSSLRGFIERNSIALLSNYSAGENPIDPPSTLWLGKFTRHEAITRSGLWNVNHVMEKYNPSILQVLEQLIQRQDQKKPYTG